MRNLPLLGFYLYGFLMVFLNAFGVALLAMWIMQFIALGFGDEVFVWAEVLWHLFLMFSFIAFFPGQRVWPVHVRDAKGNMHMIVGGPVPK